MAKETTQPKKCTINCNDNKNAQLTTIPLTSTSTNTTKNKNNDKTPLQDDAIYNVLSHNNTLLSESSEISKDKEYAPSKEPYENEYIKLTTIDASEFLPVIDEVDDAVLSIIRKATNLTCVFCLVSSTLAAFISRLDNNLGFWFFYLSWTKFYTLSALFWVYYLYRLNSSSLSLRDTINSAKKIAMGISISQLIYQIFIFITNNIKADLVGGNPLIYAGSVISFPFLVLLEEILNAYQKENFVKRGLVYNAIDRFSERKGLYLSAISKQLRQTTDMAVDTLKQLSPPHFLSKPHEQLSACSISFPTASINAIHNILNDINYISTHLGTLSLLLFSEKDNQGISHVKREFDIGEIIQQVGDVLAGDACNAKVELVIYHVEYGLNHLNVIGDEAALKHSLLDLLKCIIDGASPGDCVELGLQIRLSSESKSQGSEKERTINPHDKVICTIEIKHHTGITGSESKENKHNIFPKANLSHKILSFLGAKLDGLKITIELEAGTPLSPPNVPNGNEKNILRYPHSRITGEPPIEELIKTSLSMKGQRVALHATSKSHFAQHISSCLTTWNTDIVPIGGDEEFETPRSETSSHLESKIGTLIGASDATSDKNDDEQPLNANLPPTFIIIDDDIETLKQQLTQLKKVPPFTLNAMTARSKKQGQASNSSSQTIAVIHFTSLANYKSVKDAVQYIISPATSTFSLPQVLVIPKPAGPRRFLTALHTTINRIVVDPVYMPIATSPMSPSQQLGNGVFNKNPPENVGDPKPNGPPENYFDITCHPVTPSALVGNQPSNVNSPLSPRSGPSGGILIIPKPKNNDMIRRVGSASPGRSITPSQNGPSSPTVGVCKVTGTPTNDGNPTAIVTSPGSNPIQPVSSPHPQTPPTQSQPSAQQSRSINNGKQTTKHKPRKKPNAETVIPPINVLIVEDNPINQTILSTFMKKKKIKYECASNGQEAVDKWQNGGFHLVLMDIQLPVMDGIEATKKIRSLEKSQKIGVFPSTPPTPSSASTSSSVSSTPISTPHSPPSTPDIGLIPVIIVALTASSLSSDRTNALAAGCNDFLTKPVSLVWLERKIQEWGCMQALIDFEGWKRWKRDGEEAMKENIGNKSTIINYGESSDKLFKNLKRKQISQVEDNNPMSDNDNKTKSKSTLLTKMSLSNSIEVNTSNQKESLQNSLSSITSSQTPSGDIKISPAGMVSSPPPIVIKPSSNKESINEPNTESNKTNNISPKIYPISALNNMKNNLISNNSLSITTNTPTPSIANTTNESSSQPSTPSSISASQRIVRKRGNTFSSTSVNMSVGDQNGNNLT